MNIKPKNRKTCPFCGAPFSSSEKYCSAECYVNAAIQRKRERDNNNPSPSPYKHTCIVCEEEFESWSKDKTTCSYECYKKTKRIPKIEHVCEICGKGFLGNKNSRLCSNECRRISNLKEYTCKICGKSFKGGPYYKYCSDECKEMGRSQYKRYIPVEKKTLICPICNSFFTSKSSSHRYCSSKCKNEQKKIKQKNNKSKKPSIIYNKECPVCSTSFTTNLSKKVYCSPICSKKAENKRRSIKEKADLKKSGKVNYKK